MCIRDRANAVNTEEQDVDMGEFEDPYGDDFESDGEIIEIDDDEEEEELDQDTKNAEFLEKKQQKAQEMVERDQSSEQNQGQQLWLPHLSKPLGPDEVLEADPTVYEMLHNVNVPWPCMTLDIIPDSLGSGRRNYPQSILMVTATQASKKTDNELMVLKLSQLIKTLVNENEEEDDEEDNEDEDMDPIVENENIPLRDTTNRLKVSPFANPSQEVLCSTMSENGDVYIYDLAPQVKAFEIPGYQIPKQAKRSLHTVKNHGSVEGFANDWSPIIKTGALLSGDCSGHIYLTQRHTSKWVTDKQAFTVGNNKSCLLYTSRCV